jgi:DNA polymerase III alpha subunit (gram-positive type)
MSLIYIHATTTGFANHDEIIEIGAISSNSTFHNIITPSIPLHFKASEVNNFYLKDGRLHYRDLEVENQCNNRLQVYAELITFIVSHKNPVLISHNMQFLKRFLEREIQKAGLWTHYTGMSLRFADSLKILRIYLPHLQDHQLRTVAQNVLSKHTFDQCMKYFDLAYNKAYTLINIMQELKISSDTLLLYAYT